LLIVFGSLLILLTGFHFWFKANAKKLFEQLVETRSHGKLKLKMDKFHFSYFSKNMELDNAVFFNTDTVNENTAYSFRIKHLKLRVNAIMPIFFRKRLIIDSLSLNDPEITVTRLRAGNRSDSAAKKDISIPGEMGKIYNSIQDALQVLKVRRFEINNCTFNLVNRIRPDEKPVKITKLFLHLDNLEVDTSRFSIDKKILFSENLVLRTRNQDITFPDGRHRLSFSRFRINVRKKLVEFDSCTISSARSETNNASFNVFFDALLMTNIDFDTLYRHEVIKADSVYCVNPRFKLDVDVTKKTGPKKQAPRLDKIIRQLTGDLQLGFVVVNNADFDITTTRNGIPSTFNFTRNNFELQGLNINDDPVRPLKVKSFAMAIRNYENFLHDSTLSLRFDSILFNKNRIVLSNFNLKQLEHGKVTNSFTVPHCELQGLSWDALLFERRLQANQATLFDPVINYTVHEQPEAGSTKKKGLFQYMTLINNLIRLEDFNITNGTLNLDLPGEGDMHLEHTDLSVQSKQLLVSRRITEFEQSVNSLNFRKGIIHLNGISAGMLDVHYSGDDNQLTAGSMQLSDKGNKLQLFAEDVKMNAITLDSTEKNLSLDGISWKQADLQLETSPATHLHNGPRSSLLLEHINGANTNVRIHGRKQDITGYIDLVTADLFKLTTGEKPEINNLAVSAKNIESHQAGSLVTIGRVTGKDLADTKVEKFHFSDSNSTRHMKMDVPSAFVVPDLNQLIHGKLRLKDVVLNNPEVDLFFSGIKTIDTHADNKQPDIRINSIVIKQPKLSVETHSAKGTTRITWNGMTHQNDMLLKELQYGRGNSNSGTAASVDVQLDDFSLQTPGGKTFRSDSGSVSSKLSDISWSTSSNGTGNWSARIDDINASKFAKDSLGRAKGKLDIRSASASNIRIGQAQMKNIRELITQNPAFIVEHFDGSWKTPGSSVVWYQAAYDRSGKQAHIDSVIYKPALDRDSSNIVNPFQHDHISVSSGAVNVGGFDIDRFLKDSLLQIGTLQADQIAFIDYRDKRLPFKGGKIRPLPVNLVKKIPFRFSADTLLITNSYVSYAEVNPKNNETGTVTLSRFHARFFPVRNFNLGPTDSMRLQANAYLMDTAWIRLRMRESYTDSLGGFLMTLRMKPANVEILNPVLIPMTSVKIQSGMLDTISMRAVANEHLAYGDMKMFYHDLKIKFLRNGDETKRSFMTSLITFVANSFVIRNNNRSRTGKVFFLRDRERSAVSYLIKIAMSGIASSVGAKSNRKIIRRYKKFIHLRNLPPVDYD